MDARQFLAEFEHIASAASGVQRLREMIYSLAVTGDLTPQLASDGDAQSLLRRVEDAKNSLIVEGKFKRSPKLENQPLISPANIALPKSWCWSRLVDIGEINPKNEVADDAPASFVPMSGVPQTHSGTLQATTRPWGQIKNGFTQFADNDVVLAKITPCFENGKAAVVYGLTNGIGAGTTELHVIRPLQGLIDSAYVHIFLRSPYFVVEGESNMTGTAGQKRLPTEYFATRAFPLPPTAEQQRIVAKVDVLMALCDRLEAQQQQRGMLSRRTRRAMLDSLVAAHDAGALIKSWSRVSNEMQLWLDDEQAVSDLKDAVNLLGCRGLLTESATIDSLQSNEGDFALPPGWSWMTLKQLRDYVTSGSRNWREFLAPQGDIFVRSQNIKFDSLALDDVVFVNLPAGVEAKRALVRAGDLLITITGANVGKCAQVPNLPNKAYVSQHVALVRLQDERHAPFLHKWIINAFGGRKYLARFIYGDKPGLNLRQIESIPLPLPQQDAQDRIVEVLRHYNNLCDSWAAQKKNARRLAELFAKSSIATITGIRIDDKHKDKMKAPKTELVSTLRVGNSPTTADPAPLAALLARNDGVLRAKRLWELSGLSEIDAFYQQLKTEMAKGWIVQPDTAYVLERDAEAD